MSEKSTPQAAVQMSGLQYAWSRQQPPVLRIEDLCIEHGECVFIEGPSGSGKSTLLSLLAGIILPQQGTITINGQQINGLNGSRRDRFRADHIGYIYQMFNLIPYLSVIENVTLPCSFSRKRRERISRRQNGGHDQEALRLLDELGLGDPALLGKRVTELSVGQQQRVAAARALIGSPELLIADEPTSALDTNHREAFIRLLFEECEKEKITLVFVSHDPGLEKLFHRTIRLREINKTPVS